MNKCKRIAVGALLLAAFAGFATRTEAAINTVLVIGSQGVPPFLFVPSNSVITVGDTILWTNRSGTSHDVTQGIRPVQAPNPYWSPIPLAALGNFSSVTFSNTGFFP